MIKCLRDAGILSMYIERAMKAGKEICMKILKKQSKKS